MGHILHRLCVWSAWSAPYVQRLARGAEKENIFVNLLCNILLMKMGMNFSCADYFIVSSPVGVCNYFGTYVLVVEQVL